MCVCVDAFLDGVRCGAVQFCNIPCNSGCGMGRGSCCCYCNNGNGIGGRLHYCDSIFN